MYIHLSVCVCESQRCFSLFSPLNILHTLFSLPSFCLSAVCLLLCPVPFCLLCPVTAVPFALSPPLPLSPSGAPLKLPGGLLCVVLLPSLVSYQAQDGVTVWANATCVYPRPCLPLSMCCRVFCCPFCGFRPSVRVCVLLPCVFWW